MLIIEIIYAIGAFDIDINNIIERIKSKMSFDDVNIFIKIDDDKSKLAYVKFDGVSSHILHNIPLLEDVNEG